MTFLEFTEMVRSKTSLLEVASDFTKLRKQGRHWAGLSPFKHERTPSFFVNDGKGWGGVFYCYSSQQGGDLINFLLAMPGLGLETTADAFRWLGERYGLPMPDSAAAAPNPCRELLNRTAQEWHLRLMDNAEALMYLMGDRQIPMEVLEKFRIGLAGPLPRNTDPEHAKEAGLMTEEGRLFFSSRIVFPIRNTSGQVVSFGGRIWGDQKGPKYINGRETAYFRKDQVLYGLYENAKHSRESIVVCESYMDVVGMAAAGDSRWVATMGTAMSHAQASVIARSEHVIICRNADPAGVRAVGNDLERMMEAGKAASVCTPLLGKDGDDCRKSGAPAADWFRTESMASWMAAQRSALPLQDAARRAAVVKRVAQIVSPCPDATLAYEVMLATEAAMKLPEGSITGLRAAYPQQEKTQAHQSITEDAEMSFCQIAIAAYHAGRIAHGECADWYMRYIDSAIDAMCSMTGLQDEDIRKLAPPYRPEMRPSFWAAVFPAVPKHAERAAQETPAQWARISIGAERASSTKAAAWAAFHIVWKEFMDRVMAQEGPQWEAAKQSMIATSRAIPHKA